MSKEELKAKIGNMKISKSDLNGRWEDYESERKDKIAKILEVSYNIWVQIIQNKPLIRKGKGSLLRTRTIIVQLLVIIAL